MRQQPIIRRTLGMEEESERRRNVKRDVDEKTEAAPDSLGKKSALEAAMQACFQMCITGCYERPDSDSAADWEKFNVLGEEQKECYYGILETRPEERESERDESAEGD